MLHMRKCLEADARESRLLLVVAEPSRKRADAARRLPDSSLIRAEAVVALA